MTGFRISKFTAAVCVLGSLLASCGDSESVAEESKIPALSEYVLENRDEPAVEELRSQLRRVIMQDLDVLFPLSNRGGEFRDCKFELDADGKLVTVEGEILASDLWFTNAMETRNWKPVDQNEPEYSDLANRLADAHEYTVRAGTILGSQSLVAYRVNTQRGVVLIRVRESGGNSETL